MANAAPEPLPELACINVTAWHAWLRFNHARSPGVWMIIAKEGTGLESIAYPEALEEALCYGWVDGEKQSGGEHYWLQQFTPRGPRGSWSRIDRDIATALIAAGRMQPAGQAEIERARADGRWDGDPSAL